MESTQLIREVGNMSGLELSPSVSPSVSPSPSLGLSDGNAIVVVALIPLYILAAFAVYACCFAICLKVCMKYKKIRRILCGIDNCYQGEEEPLISVVSDNSYNSNA